MRRQTRSGFKDYLPDLGALSLHIACCEAVGSCGIEGWICMGAWTLHPFCPKLMLSTKPKSWRCRYLSSVASTSRKNLHAYNFVFFKTDTWIANKVMSYKSLYKSCDFYHRTSVSSQPLPDTRICFQKQHETRRKIELGCLSRWSFPPCCLASSKYHVSLPLPSYILWGFHMPRPISVISEASRSKKTPNIRDRFSLK